MNKIVKKFTIDDVLSDFEKEMIKQFMDNQPMCEAVKKVLLAGAYYQGTIAKGEPVNTTYNAALSLVASAWANGSIDDAALGSDLKALWAGLNNIEAGFSNMANYRTEEEKVAQKENPAR